MTTEGRSLFHALRQKRQFIPGGYRDLDGVATAHTVCKQKAAA